MAPSLKTPSRFHPAWLCVAALVPLSFSRPSPPVHAAVVTDPALPAGLPDTGHSAPLAGLDYSPDGTLLYTLDTIGELRGREVQGGRTAFRANAGSDATQMRVLPDGSLLVGRSFGAITWYNTPVAGKPLARRGAFKAGEVDQQLKADPRKGIYTPFYSLQLNDFVPSPDGALLAIVTLEKAWKDDKHLNTGDTSAHLRVWDMKTTTIVHEWPLMPTAGGVPHVAWGDGGKTLVVALPDVAIQRFNARTGALQSEWKPPAQAATRPDPADEEAEMKRRLELLPEHLRERVKQAMEKRKADAAANPQPAPAPDFGKTQAISADGKLLLALTRNGWQLWDTTLSTNRILDRSQRHTAGDEAAFSANGALIAVRNGGRFWLWRSDGTQIGFTNVPFVKFGGLAFAPGGNSVAFSDDSGVARQWTVAAPLAPTANVVFRGYFEPWRHLSTASNAMWAATARRVASIDAAGHPKWFPVEPIEAPAELPDYAKTQTRPGIVALAAAPDGKSWAESLSYEGYTATLMNAKIPRGELRVRDATTGAILWRRADTNASRTVDILRFLPDGTLLTGKGSPGSVSAGPMDYSFVGLQARNGRTGEQTTLDIAWERKMGFDQPGSVEILEVSPDGQHMVVSSGSGGAGLQVVDLKAKKVLQAFGAHSDISRNDWALSPDGNWLAAIESIRDGSTARGGSASVYLWDLSQARANTGMKATVQIRLDSSPQALGFGAEGSLAVGLRDGRIMLWAPDWVTNSAPLWETKPGRAIEALEFSPDGKTLWSGDERGDLNVRDARSGQWQSTLRLLAPKAEGTAPSWVRWSHGGKVETGP